MRASELIKLLDEGISKYGDGDVWIGETPFEVKESNFVGVHRTYEDPDFIISVDNVDGALPEECGNHPCWPGEFGCGACTFNKLMTSLN